MQSELECLLQDNAVLRSSQESTLSGVHEQEGRSLQLSQDIADMSRENEQASRKLNEVRFFVQLQNLNSLRMYHMLLGRLLSC